MFMYHIYNQLHLNRLAFNLIKREFIFILLHTLLQLCSSTIENEINRILQFFFKFMSLRVVRDGPIYPFPTQTDLNITFQKIGI